MNADNASQQTDTETFFPTTHPWWTLSLLLGALICYSACIASSTEESFYLAWSFLGPFITLFSFYLSCWFFAKGDRQSIKNLFFHTLMLVIAEFIVWLPFLGTVDFTLPQALLSLANIAAYFIIPRKLYGFSVGRSLGVVGVMFLATLVLFILAMTFSHVPWLEIGE